MSGDVERRRESVDLKTAVTQLFETETQRRLIEYALTEMDDRYYQTGELAEAVGKSRNAVTNVIQPREGVIGPMIRFGVMEPKHNPMNMPNIPHYKKADSAVMSLLKQWDGHSLINLFETTTRQKLVSFFLFEGPDEAYSVNQIRQKGPFGFKAVKENIGVLVEAGILTTEERPRTTAYRLDTDSEIYQFLGELNGAIMQSAESFQQ